jgi:hypothetical protein
MARDLLKMMIKDHPGSPQRPGFELNRGLQQWTRNKEVQVNASSRSFFHHVSNEMNVAPLLIQTLIHKLKKLAILENDIRARFEVMCLL